MGATASIVSAVVSLSAARQQKAAYEMSARQYDEQQKMAKLEMNENIIERQRNLFAQLASLSASSAARGSDVLSGTTRSFGLNERQYANKDISNLKLMGYSNINRFGLSAASARMSGRAAMTAGVANAVGSVGSAVGGTTPTSGNTAGTMKSFGQQLKREWKLS